MPKTILGNASGFFRKHGVLLVHAKALRSSNPVGNLVRVQRNSLFAQVVTRTLVSYDRLLNTYELAQRVAQDNIEGSFVECGVWQGGVAGLMAKVAENEGRGRKTHLFDSFEGCPQPTAQDEQYAEQFGIRGDDEDLSAIGLYAAGYEQVKHFLFDELGLSCNSVELHQGWFQNTLPRVAPGIGTISILRIDADWYESVKSCLDHLYPHVANGGFIILDDYGGYPGCKSAFEEYRADHNLDVQLHTIDAYGAWFCKSV